VTVGPRCVLFAHQGVSRHIGENSWRKKVDADLWQPLAADTNLPVQNKPNQSVDQVAERNTRGAEIPATISSATVTESRITFAPLAMASSQCALTLSTPATLICASQLI
jgi:hypothetical protein